MALYLGDTQVAMTTYPEVVGGTYQTKSVTYTPTTSQQTDTITPDSGYDALEEVNVTVNAMSSRVVTGTFTTSSTTASVQSVTIPYTGTGYPIMVMVEVSPDMYDSSTTWSSTIQRYAVGLISIVKPYNSAPAYGTGTGTNNYGHIYTRYKSSTSSATTYTNSGSSTVTVFSSTNPSASSTACIKFSDATTMKVFVASTSYGLMASTLYKYTIVYSA